MKRTCLALFACVALGLGAVACEVDDEEGDATAGDTSGGDASQDEVSEGCQAWLACCASFPDASEAECREGILDTSALGLSNDPAKCQAQYETLNCQN